MEIMPEPGITRSQAVARIAGVTKYSAPLQKKSSPAKTCQPPADFAAIIKFAGRRIGFPPARQ